MLGMILFGLLVSVALVVPVLDLPSTVSHRDQQDIRRRQRGDGS
ncbi:hypothetical protein [Parafrankia soli]|nr:hypothetical protein [Parafrankia soli]